MYVYMYVYMYVCIYVCMYVQSTLDISNSDTVNSWNFEVVGTIFYKFKLPEVQIKKCKKVSSAKLWLEKVQYNLC